MLESKIQSKVIAALRSSGALVFNIHGHDMQQTGIPDLYVAHWKWTGWLEIKSMQGTLKKDQEMVIRQLRLRGVKAFVLWEDMIIREHDGKVLGSFDLSNPISSLCNL